MGKPQWLAVEEALDQWTFFERALTDAGFDP
jgi:hypothetical protein